MLKSQLHELNRGTDGRMYGKTHGQNAVLMQTSDLFRNYYVRLKELDVRKNNKIKFSGAIGNSYSVVMLSGDFRMKTNFYKDFLRMEFGYEELGLTSQIDYYANITACLTKMVEAQHIINDLCQNMWSYISIGYFKQKVKKGEVGSSTMPHKVNPIKFENAEGMGKIFVNFAKTFTETLPYSRYQRDLSDSAVMRNLMACLSYHVLSIASLQDALDGVEPNREVMQREIDADLSHITEYVQLFLKLKGVHDGYEIVRDATRNAKVMNKAGVRRLLGRCAHSLNKEDYALLKRTLDSVTG